MATPIAFEDIQAGDTIRFSKEIEVSSVEAHQLLSNHGVYTDYYLAGVGSLELVDRPLPELPTKPGSVIAVGTVKEHWFLQQAHGTVPERWVNGFGSFLWTNSMPQHVKHKGFFEVLV